MKLTKESIVSALPEKAAKHVSSNLVDHINKLATEPETREYFRQNLLNYNTVLQEGKYTITAYVSAIMYVSYKMMGYSNIDAFARTFPDKMERYKKERKSQDEIHNFVSGYNRTKLVVSITTKARTPAYILNMDIHQESINVLADIMRHGKNEMAKVKAASDLMNYLTPPEDSAIKIDVGVEHSFLSNVKDALKDLVAQQRSAVAAGHATAVEMANAKIIQGHAVEVK